MTAVLKRAIDEHQWIVVTGWTPHWMFTRFKLKFLEDPKGIFGKAETITAIACKGFGEQHPFVVKLIENIHLSTEEISSLLDDVSQMNIMKRRSGKMGKRTSGAGRFLDSPEIEISHLP